MLAIILERDPFATRSLMLVQSDEPNVLPTYLFPFELVPSAKLRIRSFPSLKGEVREGCVGLSEVITSIEQVVVIF